MSVATVIAPGEIGFDQTAFNVARWSELLVNPELEKIEGRIETDRFGQIIMSPLPAPAHGRYQAAILLELNRVMDGGTVLPECPISTPEGVKGADVVWISNQRFAPMENDVCLSTAPEICVEVLSPSNSKGEIDEKKRLYFESGASEVWICDRGGRLMFYVAPNDARSKSALCPVFPEKIEF